MNILSVYANFFRSFQFSSVQLTSPRKLTSVNDEDELQIQHMSSMYTLNSFYFLFAF